VRELVAAGADLVGTSAGAQIMAELEGGGTFVKKRPSDDY